MNTPTKRIFYLFGPKIVKNEPQTKVWGSLTCKLQLRSWLRTNFAANCTGCASTSQSITLVARPVGAGCATSRAPTSWLTALLDAGLLLGALDSSHLLLGKPNGTVIFSVVRRGATKIAQVSASCFQCRHAVRRARVAALADNGI